MPAEVEGFSGHFGTLYGSFSTKETLGRGSRSVTRIAHVRVSPRSGPRVLPLGGVAIYCDCGTVLLEEVTKEGVTPVGGEPIRFRRNTDYVVCPNCYSVYRASVLQSGGSLDDARVERHSPGDADLIDKLEQMVENGDQAP